ncbi:hypothetical protein [Nostoc sp. C110]|uniref:hypothetical protein n=1 Tax=Nostoc sp. C110 TaxID=3349876 RepID=UPI00370D1FB5
MYSLRKDTEERGGDAFGGQLLETLRERLRTLKFWRCLRRASPTLFLTNHRGAEDTEEEESERRTRVCLRTVEIF